MCGVRCTVITHRFGVVSLYCRVARLLVATDECNVAARRHRRRQSDSGAVAGADSNDSDGRLVGDNRTNVLLRSTVDGSSGGWRPIH